MRGYLAACVLAAVAYLVGVRVGHGTVTGAALGLGQTASPANFSLIQEALDVVNKNFIDAPVDERAALYGATRGAVSATKDPYTDYFNPDELKAFRDDLKGSFGGIGAEIGKRGDALVIVAPIKGSPAEKAGVRAKDAIYKVGDEFAGEWTVEQAVAKIRGPKGSSVKLTLIREGNVKPLEFTIVRDDIRIESVKSEVRKATTTSGSLPVAVISVSRFGDDTKDLFSKAVTDVLSRGAKGIVVDLRSDPGGYLQGAVDLASNWLEPGTLVVSEQHKNDDPLAYKSSGTPRLKGLPTVVLMDGGTASAAEILAGALHDHGKATLLGEQSFGKGSVQELYNLKGGGAVKVTVAKWLTPSGVNLSKQGLKPDVTVGFSAEDLSAGRDPQLDAALAIAAGSDPKTFDQSASTTKP